MSVSSVARKGVKLLPVLLTYLPAIVDLVKQVKKAVKKPKAEEPASGSAGA